MLASHHANTTAVKTFQEYKASSKTAALPLFHRENAQIVFDQQGAEEHWAALNPDTAHIKTWGPYSRAGQGPASGSDAPGSASV